MPLGKGHVFVLVCFPCIAVTYVVSHSILLILVVIESVTSVLRLVVSFVDATCKLLP